MASKIRPKIRITYGRVNAPLRVALNDLLLNSQITYLTNDFASGVSALTVPNIYGIAINQVLYVGSPGAEGSEIIKTHVSTAPSGITVTLASSTLRNHSNSDEVRVIPYDQVEYSYATTLTGSKNVITTITMDVSDETVYYDSSVTTGYYFARFKNSITNAYSGYSDGCPVGSYAINTARYAIDSALGELNKDESKVFSDEYGFVQINNCQQEVKKELKRWSWLQVFGATTEAVVGGWRIPMPSDIEDINTNKSIYNFSVGDAKNIVWVDKEEWNNITSQISYTQLKLPLGIGDVTMTLNDSSDFDDSGSVQIGGLTIDYTANDKSTGILTITSSASVYTAGTEVFQNAPYGVPTYYTVHSGYIWHYPILSSEYDGNDYNLDYYSDISPITSDSDILSVPDPILVKDYLVSAYIRRMNNGEDTEGSTAAYQKFLARLKKLKQTETMNRKIIMKPRYNDYSRLMTIDGDSKFTRTQGFWPTNF